MEAQLQIRQNVLEAQALTQELLQWQDEVKKKEQMEARRASAAAAAGRPPAVRGRAQAVTSTAPVKLQQPALQPSSGRPRASTTTTASSSSTSASQPPSAAAHTYQNYKKWEKFDVDAALADEQAAQQRARSGAATGTPTRTAAAAVRAASESAAPTTLTAAERTTAARTTGASAAAPVPQERELSAEDWKNRGNKLFQVGDHDGAQKCYTRSIVLQPTCLAYANRAMAMLKLQRFAEAEEDSSRAVLLDAMYVKAYQRRAAARRELGKLLEAAEDCEMAVRLDPHSKALQADRDSCLQQLMQREKLLPLTARHKIPITRHAAPQPNGAARVASSAAVAATAGDAAPSEEARAVTQAAGRTAARGDEPAASGGVGNASAPAAAAPSPVSLPPGVAAAASTARASLQPGQCPKDTAGRSASADTLDAAEKATSSRPVPSSAVDVVPTPMPAPAASKPGESGTLSRAVAAQPAAAAAAAALPASAVASTVIPQRASKAPRTSTEFEATWRSLRNNTARQAEYLQLVRPEQLAAIFKSALTAGVLFEVVNAMLTSITAVAADAESARGPGVGNGAPAQTGSVAAHAASLLRGLTAVPRFDMTAMSVPSRQRKELGLLWDRAAQLHPGLADGAVRAKYRV